MSKVGNYKLTHTLGEGAFAKVKCNKNYIKYFIIMTFRWLSRKNWAKNSSKDNQDINTKNKGISR